MFRSVYECTIAAADAERVLQLYFAGLLIRWRT
jgi:hypothetical protein